MRFAAVIATLAGVAMAHTHEPASTHFETEYFTVTSCGPSVTDCPAHSTQVSSSVYPVITPPTVPKAPETPATPATSSSNPQQPGQPDYPVVPPVQNGSNSIPPGVTPVPTLTPIVISSASPLAETPAAAECGGQSVETVSTFYVTTIPTISFVTHDAAPCKTSTPVVPAIPTTAVTSASPSVPSNGATPPTPIPTGAASSAGASVALAAVAGVIALFV